MAIAVEAERVAGGCDLAGQSRVAPDLLADEEERRGRARAVELAQDRGRPQPVRAVIEREGDPLDAR